MRTGSAVRVAGLIWVPGRHATSSMPVASHPQRDRDANVVRAADHLIVTGRLDGKPVRILLDTGASAASVSTTLARDLRPIPGEKVRFWACGRWSGPSTAGRPGRS
jgi:hypothetical protein